MQTREHRGVALAGLGAVVLVTAAWWVLALYPAASAPEWMIRTRYVCFGAPPGGLPNAGGWILLVGQPAGMLIMLFVGWGTAVRQDIGWLLRRPVGKLMFAATLGGLLWGVGTVVRIVRSARAVEPFIANDSTPSSRAINVPALRLVDQHNREFDLRALAGGPVLVSFAFAHCETMCPTVIRQLLRIRSEAGRADIPLVVVTVDPWRDVPSRLEAIARTWRLAQHDHVLSGRIDDVTSTLNAWNIARVRNETTGDVVHPFVVVLAHPGGSKGTRFDGGLEGLRALLTGM